MLQLKGRIKF